MIRQFYLTVSVIFLFFWVLTGATLAYRNPGKPQGYVNDYAHLLSPDQIKTLETELAQLADSSGHQLTIVTINSLAGDTIENFAVQLFADWGIGQADADNGVLLLVAPNDRQVRIEVGYGLEGALTDAQTYWIIQRQILPEFKRGDYYAGIAAAVTQIKTAIEGEVIPSLDRSADTESRQPLIVITIVAFGLIWLASVLGRTKSWWLGGVIGGLLSLFIALGWGVVPIGLTAFLFLTPLGLLFDYLVSSRFTRAAKLGRRPPWWTGGGGRSTTSSSGGFGGFGGGLSGGGGSSGSW